MSAASTALERFERWLDAQDDGLAVASFRRGFAAIWGVYDVIDLAWGMTAGSRVWVPRARSSGPLALQVVLVASGAMLGIGRYVWASGMVAAVARGAEAFLFFPLNDFFFASVLYLLLAHSDGGPFAHESSAHGPSAHLEDADARRHDRRGPRWVRDALIFQLGWIYLATGVLKMHPDWLERRQRFVRTPHAATTHAQAY